MDVERYQRFEVPGHAVTGDRTVKSRGVGYKYAHSILDDHSRLAYTELLDDERADTVTAFAQRALDRFLDHGIVPERLLTDG
jgi:Integrase core domain